MPDPDDKDWTWVLDRPCPECGFTTSAVDRHRIADRLLAATPRWRTALSAADAATRPAPTIWSIVEYGCHTRDVHTTFGRRGRLIQEQQDPVFANWNQDETALEKRYWEADPADVAREIEREAVSAAGVFSGLSDAQWARVGRRSNGSVFTMETLGLYYLHDIEHHLHDVER
ncbi:DinB superfamily protein [Nakamurella panacisegetis]|uniref:DinB superfamily protein n=1 Tax=Nakamurella panacisegetis TaxID=1090615 RepID=A0A1H0MI07_9ACTN|nr:DinB superfamily protein [Nakamurella panacisegetis]